jgi:hypothetical protein
MPQTEPEIEAENDVFRAPVETVKAAILLFATPPTVEKSPPT